MKALAMEWNNGSPFVKLRTDQMEKSGQVIYEGFVNYVDALSKCVTEQLPSVLESAEALP